MFPFELHYSCGYYPHQPNFHFINSTKPLNLRCKKEEQFTKTSLTMDARIYATSNDYPGPHPDFTSLFTKLYLLTHLPIPIPNP